MALQKHSKRGRRQRVDFRETLLHVSGIVLVVSLLAGCGGQAELTTTPLLSTTTSPLTAPTVIAKRGDTEWDYVALGDSVTWGMVDQYAKVLEQDLGIKVEVHDWTVGSDHSSRLLERLRTNPELRQDLREADVITVEIPWNVVERPWKTFESESAEACGGADNQDCLRQAFGVYEADADAIIAEIVSLRSPSEALIRMQDTYQFRVRETKEAGTFEVINRYWRDANAHVIEVATRYHIPVARVYDAFMGLNGAEDPRDKALVLDGIHCTLEGTALMVELFRGLGYEYALSEP